MRANILLFLRLKWYYKPRISVLLKWKYTLSLSLLQIINYDLVLETCYFLNQLKGSLVPPPSVNIGNYRNCCLAPPLCPQNHPCTFLTLPSIPACPAAVFPASISAGFQLSSATGRPCREAGWKEGGKRQYHASFFSPPAASLTAAAFPPVAWRPAGWSSIPLGIPGLGS